MRIRFRGKSYQLVITDHARARKLSRRQVFETLRTGKFKRKDEKDKFWVYRYIKGRRDNLVAAAIVIEGSFLVVITVLVNWRPDED